MLCYDLVHIASEARLDKQRGTAAGGFKNSLYPYLVVLLDRFSRKVRLHPSARADPENAVEGILAWIRDSGVPRALFSDTVRHFQNHVVEQLETALGLEHGTSIAYAAWTNVACERAGRAALSPPPRRGERATSPDRALAHPSPRPLLNGCSPLEVWSGRPVRRALDIVVSQGDESLELVPLDQGKIVTCHRLRFARMCPYSAHDWRREVGPGLEETPSSSASALLLSSASPPLSAC
jgi:hypothetical protein